MKLQVENNVLLGFEKIYHVEEGAFFCCRNLREIIMEEGMETIGDSAFRIDFFGDSLTLSNSVRRIGASAFYDTSIHELHLPEGLELIGFSAFGFCHWLSAVTIPGTAKDLSEKVFTGCGELEEGNTWHDTCWGVDAKTSKGKNHLGKILMKVREELRQHNC